MNSVRQRGILLICVSFIICLCMGCSREKASGQPLSKEKDIQLLREKVVKEEGKTHKAALNEGVDEPRRKRQMAVSDACLTKYNSCSEKCNNSSCEDACQDALAVCEKDLPPDLKTIKN